MRFSHGRYIVGAMRPSTRLTFAASILAFASACGTTAMNHGDATTDGSDATRDGADAASADTVGIDATDTSSSIDADPGTDVTSSMDADMDAGVDVARDVFVPDAALPDGGWRSRYFPANWQPVHAGGAPDSQGRFLPDFSYAGYHRGEQHPPYGRAAVTQTVDVALGNGTTDATAGIQARVNAACSAGGGVVRIPAGTYRVRLPTATATEAIRIACSHVVLRGDGPTRTRILFDDATRARSKSVIAVRSSGAIVDGTGTTTYRLTADLTLPTQTLTLASTTGLSAGAWVMVRNDVTDGFRAEHRMDPATSGQAALWLPTNGFKGIFYPRRITRVSGNTVELDEPIQYPLRTRDNARVYALTQINEEVGIESLGIGMVENRSSPITEPGSDDDYQSTNTQLAGYQVHDARGITMDRVHDAWIYDVDTFQPAGNTSGAHVLSHGIFFAQGSFRVTVENCDFGRAQYRGGGGNGYIFHIQGNDTLMLSSTSTNARHGFTFNQASTGNALVRLTGTHSRLADDSHRFLANANLFDSVRLDGDWMQCVNRGTTSGGAGFTGTRQVWWNTVAVTSPPNRMGCVVETAQWGDGYAIGSRGEGGAMAHLCPTSFTNSGWAALDQGAPADFIEGEGRGATLYPQSLYDAQRALRCARDGIACDP